MTYRSMWEVLGIAPGADEEDIRKAYAGRLRETNPEDDPTGFKTLRAAYEGALRHAKRRTNPAEHQAEFIKVGAEPGVQTTTGGRTAASLPNTHADAASTSEQPVRERNTALHEHTRAQAALVDALGKGATPAQLIAALEAVLNGEAMQQIDVYSRTQEWLVGVIHRASPASSPLIEPVIRFFGWTASTRVNEWSGPASLFVLQEAIAKEEWTHNYLERVRDKRHEFHRAYIETSAEGAANSGLLGKLWSLRHLGVVDRFLSYTFKKFPDAVRHLDAARVKIWQTRQRRLLDGWHLFRNLVGLALIWASVIAVSVLPPPSRQRAFAHPDDQRAARESCRIAAFSARNLPMSTSVETFNALRADCAHALALMPDSLLLRIYAGVIEMRSGDQPEAVRAFGVVMRVSPHDPVAYYATVLANTMDRAPDGQYWDQTNLLFDALDGDASALRRLEVFAAADAEAAPASPATVYDTPPHVITGAGQAAMDAAYAHFGLAPLDGGATLRCLAHSDGSVADCVVMRESPWDSGAGEMAVRLAASIRAQPATSNGEVVDGAPLDLPFGFRRR